MKKINPRLPISYDGEMRQQNRWRVDAVQADFHKDSVPRLDARIIEVLRRFRKQENGGLSESQIAYLYTCIMKVLEEEE